MKLLLPAVLVAIWQYVSAWSPLAPGLVHALPPPSAVVRDAWTLLLNGELPQDAGISALRLLAGFVAAAVVAVPLGFGVALWPLFDDVVDPIVEYLRPIPPPAWIPLGILWFGVGDVQNVFILALGVFFPAILNTIEGVRRVDRTLIAAVLTLGGGPADVIREIVIPAALPLVITGLRIGLGVGWGALIAAELLAARSGLGFMVQSARFAFDTPRMLTGMIAIGLLGLAMDVLMRAVQRHWLNWSLATP
ncbi:MAG: ABC transporter permease [bacterium]|nr:ABC transporter permease [bacterium]